MLTVSLNKGTRRLGSLHFISGYRVVNFTTDLNFKKLEKLVMIFGVNWLLSVYNITMC